VQAKYMALQAPRCAFLTAIEKLYQRFFVCFSIQPAHFTVKWEFGLLPIEPDRVSTKLRMQIPGKRMQNFRVAAIILLVTFSLFVAIKNGMGARDKQMVGGEAIDSVSKWEQRVKPVLDHLPEDVTVIGYTADWDLPNVQYNLIDQENEYTFTQYALAPRAVQPGLDHEWIIGNFTNKDFRTWLDENLPSYEIIEIGFGIYLIHRTSL
jgi:hypothetical protein